MRSSGGGVEEMNVVMPGSSSIIQNSPDDSVIRGGGFRTIYDLALNDGSAGDKIYKALIVRGFVLIRRLYGVFTNVTNVDTLTTCSWQVYSAPDEAGSILTTAENPLPTDVNCSGVSLNSVIAKKSLNTAAASLLKTNEPIVSEKDADDQFQRFLVNAKQEADTWICFLCTEDANTNAVLKHYCEWVPLTPDAEVVEGPGTLVPVTPPA